MALRDVTSLVAPPARPTAVPARPDWARVENKLGQRLPRDYKSFVMTYGSGNFAQFIRVYNPFSRDEYGSLLKSANRVCDIYREIKQIEGCEQFLPFPLYPEKGGLLPWAVDDNGNWLFWLTEGSPSRWPTVVAAGRDKRWQKFDFPMTTFLGKILRKEIRCKIWPRDFPSKARSFRFEPFGRARAKR